MKPFAAFLLLTATSLAYGCASTAQTTVPFRDGEVFTIERGGSAANADRSLIVRFDAVTADSRCPIDAYCVWAGQLTVRIGVLAPDSAERMVALNTVTVPRDTIVARHRIELLDAQAPARGGDSTSRRVTTTRVQLRVTRVR